MFQRAFLIALALALAACSWAPSWGVYKIDVNQGNYLTRDMVEKLKAGQTRSQVKAVLGTPLVADSFHADRWDYVYEFRRQGKLVTHRSFAVYFAEDKLVRWEGEEQPISPAILNRQAQVGEQGTQVAEASASTTPEERGFFGRLWDALKF